MPDDLVLTPGGLRPKSHVHLIESGSVIDGSNDRLRKLGPSDKVLTDFSAGSQPQSNITSITPISESPTPEPPVSSPAPPLVSPPPESSPPADQGTTVSGQVVYRDTGEPYGNAIVEFRNLYGENVHTTTDVNGYYSVQLPADTYTAFALDLNDHNQGFEVSGRPDNAVTVPPSATVNFDAYPIT